jgi:hypothetical protein
LPEYQADIDHRWSLLYEADPAWAEQRLPADWVAAYKARRKKIGPKPRSD